MSEYFELIVVPTGATPTPTRTAPQVVSSDLPNGTLHSFRFRLARVWQPYFWNFFIVIALMMMLGFVTFMYPSVSLDNMMICMVILFTEVAIKANLDASGACARVGYLTVADLFAFLAMGTNIGQAMLHSYCFYWNVP